METPNIKPREPEIRRPLKALWEGLKLWFIRLIDLQDGMDREGTIIAIRSGKLMQGANAWMLICSIMIASLGLDLNSAAVIIGAMLISPLMSPILGVGLGVATNDREALLLALKHFGISIIIALVTSTLYFWITPLGTLTDEIRARTAPTLLDGLVAVFGGLAGIISMTRKDKSNAIPGVAIATALMPPLCVTGFGLSIGNWTVALSSFYLFFLNSFFIALTSYFIIRLLKFPFRQQSSPEEARRAKMYIAVFSLLIIIPGGFILKNVISDLTNKQNVKLFVDANFANDYLDYEVFPVQEDSSFLVIQLRNRVVSNEQIVQYNKVLKDSFYLPHIFLKPVPDMGVRLKDVDNMALQVDQLNRVVAQLDEMQNNIEEQQRMDSLVQAQIHTHAMDSLQFYKLSATLHQASQFSKLIKLSFGENLANNWTSPVYSLPVFTAEWADNPGRKTKESREEEIRVFLQAYLKTHDIKLDSFAVHSY